MFKTIGIPFTEWSKKRLGVTKFSTTRVEKYGEVGDCFVVNGCEYQLIHVVKLPLVFVRNVLYQWEGAESPEEFEREWIKIHPMKGYEPYWEVWYHHFAIRRELQKESK